MVKPFNSSKFFGDAFFSEIANVNGSTVAVVTQKTDELTSEGRFSSLTGRWVTFAVLVNSLASIPAYDSEIVYESETYAIKQIRKEGDVYLLDAITDQRRNSR